MQRLSCALLVILAACSANTTDANKDGIADGVKTPSTVTAVAPATPTGSVSGLVTDTKFVAVGAANVVLELGGTDGASGSTFKTTTDVDGTFSFKTVPAGGSGQVVITKDGYGSARISVTVPGTAGNVPLDNGNANVGSVELTELSATVKFYVYGSTGAPAKGAVGLLEVTPSALITSANSTGYGTGMGVTSAQATVDDTGALVFTGVPQPTEITRLGGTYTLTIGAWDAAGDGTYDSLGFVRSYSGSTLFTNPYQTIMLPDARQSANLSILASNLDSLTGGPGQPFRNAVSGTNSINVVFNQPIAASTLLSVKVVAEDCTSPVAVKVEQKAPNLLTITPTSGWSVGNEYHVAIHATGTDASSTAGFVGYFWGIDPAAPRPVSTTVSFVAKKATGNTNTGALQPNDDLYVVFDTPVRFVAGGAAQAFVNFDLNGSGSIGTGTGDVGEFGNASGLAIALSEQSADATTSTFSCKANSIGTRWKVGPITVPTSGVPVGTMMKVVVPQDSTSVSGYETVWGQPFSGTYSGVLSVQQ